MRLSTNHMPPVKLYLNALPRTVPGAGLCVAPVGWTLCRPLPSSSPGDDHTLSGQFKWVTWTIWPWRHIIALFARMYVVKAFVV